MPPVAPPLPAIPPSPLELLDVPPEPVGVCVSSEQLGSNASAAKSEREAQEESVVRVFMAATSIMRSPVRQGRTATMKRSHSSERSASRA
jgi:hypothetical protein